MTYSTSTPFEQPLIGATPRTVQTKLQERVSVQDFGAKGDGSTNDGAAFAAPGVGVRVPSATYAGPSGFSLASVRYRGMGADSVLAGAVTLGANTVIEALQVNNAASTAVLSSASGVGVTHSTINAPAASGINVSGANGITGTRVSNTRIAAQNYGMLLSTTGFTGGSKVATIGCDITTVMADCIEYNMPGAGFTGTIAALNFLANTASSGGGTAGFGIGIAAARYNAVLGNAILGSRLEIIHIEDSQRGTTIVGNTGVGLADGIRVYEATAQDNMPVSIVANTLENSQGSPTGIGVNLYWATPGTPAGDPVIGNVLHNYSEGISVGGVATGEVNTIQPVMGNTMVGCSYGVTAWGNSNQGTVRQSGLNMALGASTLFMTKSASARFGKMVTNTPPTAIIANTNPGGYGGSLPSSCDGFEFPLGTPIAVSSSAGGQTLFTAGGPYRGRIKFQAKANVPTTDWCHISADITWDGSTFTIANVLSRVNGVITSISITNSGANPYVNIRSSSNTTLQAGWIEFDGEYWDA